VATPAINSTSGKTLLINPEKASRIALLISGNERVILLSQYIGDFHPEAHVKGFAGSNFIALLCNKYCGINLSYVAMFQDYKIYFSDRVVILTSKINKTFDKSEGLFLKNGKKDEIDEVLKAFEQFTHTKSLYLLGDDAEHLFNQVKTNFTIIEAAGGVVKRADGKMLAILRRGKWDLPKGKVEKGEFYKQAAIREVQEECGLSDIEITKKIAETYHTYNENGITILKRTFWYEMILKSDEQPVVQTSEDITEYLWFDFQSVKDIMKNTYESLKDIFLVAITPENNN
jgi:8-oxo-dGTP pyrophosphatase MutT (NUDIX family)